MLFQSYPRSNGQSGLALSIIAITIVQVSRVSSLGINCRGSGLCPRASWNNAAPESVIQILRDAVWDSVKPNSTNYNSGDHVIWVSQSQPITIDIGADIDGLSGTFGLSGQHSGRRHLPLPARHRFNFGANPSPDRRHSGANDPSDGILTFSYVQDPFCVGSCISDTGSSGVSSVVSASAGGSAATTALTSESAASFTSISTEYTATTQPSEVVATKTTISEVANTVTGPSTSITSESTATSQPSETTVTVTAPVSSSGSREVKIWDGVFIVLLLCTSLALFKT